MRITSDKLIPPSKQEDYRLSREQGELAGDEFRQQKRTFNRELRRDILEKTYKYGRLLFRYIEDRMKTNPDESYDELIEQELRTVVLDFADISDYQREIFNNIVTLAMQARKGSRNLVENIIKRQALTLDQMQELGIAAYNENYEPIIPATLTDGQRADIYFMYKTGSKPTGKVNYKFNGAYVQMVCELESDFTLFRTQGQVQEGQEGEEETTLGLFSQESNVFGGGGCIVMYDDNLGTLRHEERHFANTIIKMAYRMVEENDTEQTVYSNQVTKYHIAKITPEYIKSEENQEELLEQIIKICFEDVKDEILARMYIDPHKSGYQHLQLMRKLPENIISLFIGSDVYPFMKNYEKLLLVHRPSEAFMEKFREYESKYIAMIRNFADTMERLNQVMLERNGEYVKYTEHDYNLIITIMQNYDFEEWDSEIQKSFAEEFAYYRNTIEPKNKGNSLRDAIAKVRKILRLSA